jgi:hypothetical protein
VAKYRELRFLLGCAAGAGILVAASLGACTRIEVDLGLRTRLDKLPVTALSASLSHATGLAPGQSAPLIIVATTSDGKTYVTEGAGQGKVLFDSFTFDAAIVQVDKKGVVLLPADPRLSEGLLPHIRIVPLGHPDVVADLDVPARYDVDFVAACNGAPGQDGISGMDGLSGSDGTTGTVDASGNMGPGGNGSDGGNGGDGTDGGPGAPGPTVQVRMTLAAGARPLLQVSAEGPSGEQLYLVDPAGGSLEIDANGGRGGSGGSGGRGGSGGAGGVGTPSGLPGQDGRTGWDGQAGAPGAAGSIVVTVDPKAQSFVGRLRYVNHNGDGVPGLNPQVSIESVPAIW